MATRNVDTAIRYAISVSEKGLQQAVALTKDLSVQSKATQVGVDASMKAVQTQYNALAKVAASADSAVAKAAIDSATTVNKALDSQVAKLRDAGASYTAIIAKQKELGASAAELAAAVRRSSAEQIASMQAVRAEADRTVRQRLSMAASSVGGAAAAGVRGVGGVVVGGTALGVGLAYESYRKTKDITESATQIHGATGLDPRSATALAVLASSTGVNPRTISQAFATSGAQLTKALAGNAPAQANFRALGITEAQGRALRGNGAGLIDLITSRLQTLPQTQQAALGRTFLGRGAAGLQPLLAEGALGGAKGQISTEKAAIGDISPKDLAELRKNVVELNREVTNFELHFIKAFGPTISSVLKAVAPLLAPVGRAFEDAFRFVGSFFKSSAGKSIISGLESFGRTAFDAGKKLLDAFKPAEPFLKNVILPLLKGFVEGVGIGIVGAIKIATPIVKVLSVILGALGDFLKPLKPAIEDVGRVLGVVFGPGVIGKAIAFVGKLTGEIPFVGKVLEDLLKPVEVVGSGIGKLYDIVAGTFSKILGFIPGVGSKLASLLGGLAASIVGAFAAVPNAVGSVFSSIGDVIGNALVAAVNIGIGVINSGSGLINSFTHAVGLGNVLPNLQPLTAAAAPAPAGVTAPRHGGTFRDGGLVFNAGGLVPAMVSPQEQVIYGNSSWMVPGSPTAADSVFAMLPPGAAVMTGHGQALMGMGASLDEALAMQMPHFAAGGAVNALGWNVKAPGGRGGHGGRSRGHSRGSTATPRYLHNVLIGNFTTAGWHAYLLAHPSTSSTRALSHYGIPGLVGLAEGGGFSGENAAIAAAIAEAESGGDVHSVNTAGNSPPSRDRGLWQFNDYWNKNISDQVAFDPFAAAKAAYQTFRSRGFRDWVTYNQGQYRRFLPAAEAALHSGVAPITSGTPQGVLQAAARAKVGIPTLSNATASLTGQTAFAGGFQAGLSGLNLMDTVHSGILSQLLGDVAVTKSSSSPTGAAASVASSVGPSSGGYVFPLPDFGSEQRVDRGQDMESKRPYANTVALGSGTVTTATIGWPGMRLLLDSGAYKGQTVFYGHNNAMHAKLGQHLRAGQLIGQVGNLSGGGDSRHTEIGFMGGYNSQSGHWVGPGSSGGMLMHRLLHQMAPQWIGAKAMRRGGVVGKHHHPAALNPITGANTKIGALLAQGDAANVDAAFTALAGSLDDAASFTQASLLALAQKVHSHSRKGLDTIQQRRLDTVMNLIDAALGNRVGLLIASAQDAVDTIARGNAHRVALSTLSGVDPGSTKGLQLAVQLDQAVLSGLNAQVGVLQRAKETAKKYGDKATIKTVTDELNTALGNLDQAAVQAMNDWKASVERATQDAVDSASQAVSVAQAGEGILSLQQQLAGTDQTPGGGQATSAYISSTVIPALQAQLAAQQADQAAAASVGDTARVNQDILSELQTQTSILSEQKTAQDAIKANTTPLKTFGGQLAFQFQGSNFTDLAALAPGS